MIIATLRQGKAPAIVDVEATVMHPETMSHEDLTESIPTSPVEPELDDPMGSTSDASTAIARTPSSTPARQTFSGEGIEGDWGQEDLKFPQLKIVQGSGELSKQFNNGEIVFGTSDSMQKLLSAPHPKTGLDKPIRFVPITIKKQYREKLTQDAQQDGQMPRIFDSIEKVEAAGLTTRWSKEMVNYVEPSGNMVALIEEPHGAENSNFVLPFGAKNYTVAVYYAAGGAFRDSLRNIFNVALASLMVPVMDENGQPQKNEKGHVIKKPMLYKNFWTLNFVKKDVAGFAVWRPEVKLLPKDETSPEIRAYCADLINGVGQAADIE